MEIETLPSVEPHDESEGKRRGLVSFSAGDGKSKSTATFGLALRAHDRGKPFKIWHFIKVPSARFGEHWTFEQLGTPSEGLCNGFSWKRQDLEHSGQRARAGRVRAKASILSSDYFRVVLDEITCPLIDSSLPLGDALLTVKQAFKAGIPAQRGIGD